MTSRNAEGIAQSVVFPAVPAETALFSGVTFAEVRDKTESQRTDSTQAFTFNIGATVVASQLSGTLTDLVLG